MSTAGHTPNFIAQETLYPFRVVQFGSNAFSLMHATQSDEVLAGVTDGSVQGFNATTHATAGQVCSLQNGEFVQVTAGDTIVPADLLVATNDGKVIPAQLGSTEAILQAAEGAEDGEILWAKRIGAWTLGGSSPITGGLSIDVQEFEYSESGQVWTKPAGAYMVYVTMCGAGCDGPDFTAATGGSAGMTAQKWFIASLLPSTVNVACGLNMPYGYGQSATACTYFGDPNGILYLAAAAQFGGANQADAGIDVTTWPQVGLFKFGQGAGDDSTNKAAGAHGYAQGPGGGGTGGGAGYGGPNGNEGGRAGTNAWPSITGAPLDGVQAGGGGAGGIGGGLVGGNAPAAGYDPVTGFGHGGGGGGYGISSGGNGGNAVRGGGGGAPGYGVGELGLPGAGGTGFVRVTTICFS